MDEHGFRMDPLQIEVLRDWKRPINIHNLQSFLCLANFNRKFVRGFLEIAHSLHQITNAKRAFEWGIDQQDDFDLLKYHLCIELVLAMPNLQLPFEVEADASGHVLGEVLTQQGKPVAYHSESFLKIVQKYNTYHKETYTIV